MASCWNLLLVAQGTQESSFDPLFPPQETPVTPFKSVLPHHQGVMADYMARLEAAKRKAEALEMQRQQHMQEQQEVEASAASASIVAAAAETEEASSSTQAAPASAQAGPRGILGDYMSTLEAARARQERQAAGKGKQAQAVIPDLDLEDVNRTGSGPIDILLKPQVSRGVNTQLAHLARVAAELRDLAGHVGQRAEGKQVTRPNHRQSGIRSLQPTNMDSSGAAVQPVRQQLNLEDFGPADAPQPDLGLKTD